jgi:hypothetical protein
MIQINAALSQDLRFKIMNGQNYCLIYYITICRITGAAVLQSVIDWLRAGRPRGRSSSPGRVKTFHFSVSNHLSNGYRVHFTWA